MISKCDHLCKSTSLCLLGVFWLAECQGRKTFTITLEKKVLLPIWEGLQDHFQTFWSLSERLFTKGKHLRQMPIFAGVEVPANPLQDQTVQCSKKLKKPPQKTQLTATCQTVQTSVSMLNVSEFNEKVQLESEWTSVASWKGCLLSLKWIYQQGWFNLTEMLGP